MVIFDEHIGTSDQNENDTSYLLDSCFKDADGFADFDVDHKTAPSKDVFHHNVALMLTNPFRSFNRIYQDMVEKIIQSGKTLEINESFLPIPVKRALYTVYGNDSELALQKFEPFAQLMFAEEILRVANPIFENLHPISSKSALTTLTTVEFEIPPGRIPVITSPTLLICVSESIHGSQFHYFEGLYVIVNNVLKVICKLRPKITMEIEKTYNIYEKPYDTSFDAWNHMIKAFRKRPCLTSKLFGPLMFPYTRGEFLRFRTQKIESLFPPDDNDITNTEQKYAIFSMAVQDPRYAFVLFGPPGTGKTTTLVEAIKVIQSNYTPSTGDSEYARFLVCTPSNAAADTFALALLQRNFDPKTMFRAMSSRYPTEDRDRRLDEVVYIDNRGNYIIPDVKQVLRSYHIVITTLGFCQSMRPLGPDHFTHIIVDEAGQCLEPELCIPLGYYANEHTNVILAGDPQQLGPVLMSNILNSVDPRYEANLSSLVRLSNNEEYRNDARLMVQLNNNHRNHKFIVGIISRMFYNGTLRSIKQPGHSSLCGTEILDSASQLPVRFVSVYGREERVNPSYFNQIEMDAVEQYVEKCLNYGIAPSDIGIVTPYRETVTRLQALFKKYPRMTIDTVERFQGSERRVMIMSTVRTDQIGFLNDYRRFNTAITRAKHMLIVIGDPYLLAQDPTWEIFLYYLWMNNCFNIGSEGNETRNYWNRYFAKFKN